jgi:hypothetical protein
MNREQYLVKRMWLCGTPFDGGGDVGLPDLAFADVTPAPSLASPSLAAQGNPASAALVYRPPERLRPR